MRYSIPWTPSEPSREQPVEPGGFVTADVPDEASQKGLGPSAFQGTDRPFLAKVLGFTTTEMRDFGLGREVAEVDDYILAIVKERNWADNEAVYQSVLSELRANLGLHQNLDTPVLFERLVRGVRLLKLQAMHRRREREIQKTIERINK